LIEIQVKTVVVSVTGRAAADILVDIATIIGRPG